MLLKSKTGFDFSKATVSIIIIAYSTYPIIFGYVYSLSWDVVGYYFYLPATFIHGNLKLTDFTLLESINKTYNISPGFYQFVKAGDNTNVWVDKYPMGIAFLVSPFFALAHLYVKLNHLVADGYSSPYNTAFVAAPFFYVSIGFLYLRKALREFFSSHLTSFLLIAVFFFTNFFCYATTAYGMSHNFLFAFYSILIWQTIRWHKNKNLKNSFLLGFIMGFMTVIRASDLLCLLIPLLWNCHSFADVKAKIVELIKQHPKLLATVMVAFIIPVFPQMLYWKWLTGYWFFYSYQNPGEGFDLLTPHTLNYFFSYRNGWLLYSPIMIFSLIGLYSSLRRKTPFALAFLVFSVLNIYLLSSWTTWWYGGSFGNRSIIQSYAVLIFSMGVFISSLSEMKNVFKVPLVLVLIFFCMLTIFQTWQFKKQILHYDLMSGPYYWKVFGKTSLKEEDKKLLLPDKYALEQNGPGNESDYSSTIFVNCNYESADAPNFQNTSFIDSAHGKCLKMDSTLVYGNIMSIPYREFASQDYVWIKTEFDFMVATDIKDAKPSLVLTADHGGGYGYVGINLEQKFPETKINSWNHFSTYYITPNIRSPKDNLNIYFWLRGNGIVYFDNVKVTRLEKK